MGEHRAKEDETAKVVMRENLRTEYQDAVIEAGDRHEIVLAPAEPMARPVLSMSSDSSDGEVDVEQVACGNFVVIVSPGMVKDYWHGRELGERVSAVEPVRILLVNRTPKRAKIAVSLSVIERAGVYSIIKGT